uniref:(California timema) hypothetical protein n=1 Tax=Timema californicum TaxID=61474 RepID=A0A7R9PA69_TIMCA|nr:unnamed protein product [Timema californicum]
MKMKNHPKLQYNSNNMVVMRIQKIQEEIEYPEVSDIEPDVSSKMQQLILMSLLAPYLVLSVAGNKEDQQISHHGEFLDDTYFNTQYSELESQEKIYGAGSDSDKQDKYDYDGDGTTYFRYISSQLSERYFDTNEQKKIVYSDTSNVNKFEYNPINEKLNQTWWENESQKTPSREDNLSFGETPSFGLTNRSDFNNDQIISLNEMELNRKTSALNQSKLSAEEELDGTYLKIPPLEIVNREDLRSTFPETDSQELYYHGDGANPVSVEFRRFKTAFDIAEALGAVDLLKIRENNLVKPLTRVVRWLNNKFEPETHIGYWKVPLRESGKPYWKSSLFTPDLDSNPDLSVIGKPVYCESSALDHAAIEAALRQSQDFRLIGASFSAEVQLLSTLYSLPGMFGIGDPIKSQNQPSKISAHAL